MINVKPKVLNKTIICLLLNLCTSASSKTRLFFYFFTSTDWSGFSVSRVFTSRSAQRSTMGKTLMKKKAESTRFYTFDPPLSNSGFTIYQNRNIARSLLKTCKIHYLSKPSTGKGWGYGTPNSFPPVVFNQGKPIFQWSEKFFSKGLWTGVNMLFIF